MASEALSSVSALLYREARCLDCRDWDGWLRLYLPEAWFWVPTWRDESTLTDDPQRALSLMYFSARTGLEERIARLTSGRSLASTPLPRTTHLLSNIEVEVEHTTAATAHSSVVTFVYNPRNHTSLAFYGKCVHHLREVDEGWRISGKKFILMNDQLPAFIDINML